MPAILPNETRKDFVARCVPLVLADESAKSVDQAVAMCFSMWDEKKEKLSETTKEFTGVMVGMFLPLPAAVALDVAARDLPFYIDREDARNYHVTLAYLGDMFKNDFDKEAIENAVGDYVASQDPISGTFSGIGKFDKKTENGDVPIYTNFDSPQLPEFRQGLVDALQSIGVFMNPEHGFTPHITLGYMWENIEEIPNFKPPQIDFEIENVTVAFGDERTNFSFKKSETEEKSLSLFSTVKDASGEYRWISVSSNSYQDKEGQIVSQKALEADVSRIEPNNDYGPLRWWHLGGVDIDTQKALPGVDVGDCDFRMMRGKFLVESGTYRSPELAHAFKDFDGQISVRFLHPKSEPGADGVFHNIKIVERSLIPHGRAANPFTSFTHKSKETFQMDEKVKSFMNILDDESLADDILKAVDAKQKALDESGVKSKDDSGILSKIKSLVMSDENQEETKPVIDADTIKEIVSTTVSATLAAISAKEKADAVVDNGNERNEKIEALEARISGLEGDVKDAGVELAAAQKELSELIGDGGYRASKDDETIVASEKDDAGVSDGLADFVSRIGQ